MENLSAAQSGTFEVGGDIRINRLGFGAMRITGPRDLGRASRSARSAEDLEAFTAA